MILYEAAAVNVGLDSAKAVRHGTDLVWSNETSPEGIWTFPDTPGDTIVLTATFSPGISSAHWGDGNIDALTSGTSVTHNY
jgi:hypothetical protein